MHKDLKIQYLAVGASILGTYRGDLFHEIPEPDPGVMGRVFLDTDQGPMAIGGNESLRTQLQMLDVQDGDSITVVRNDETTYHVAKGVPDGE
jgi:hypothetical protein